MIEVTSCSEVNVASRRQSPPECSRINSGGASAQLQQVNRVVLAVAETGDDTEYLSRTIWDSFRDLDKDVIVAVAVTVRAISVGGHVEPKESNAGTKPDKRVTAIIVTLFDVLLAMFMLFGLVP